MKTVVLKRDSYFFPLVFAVWGIFMFMLHGRYSFFDAPLPSAGEAVNLSDIIQNQGTIDLNIEELGRDLGKEVNLTEKGHIFHNIGTAYYDQYRRSSRPDLLDSSQAFYERSIKTLDNVGRFYYNLGRVFTERRNHLKAKEQYELAIRVSPDHVLALHNLALLNYFELGNSEAASALLKRALSIRGDLPICNYILGEIAAQNDQYDSAVVFFEAEISSFKSNLGGKHGLPASMSAMRYAAVKCHRSLALIYSTRYPSQEKAQQHFHAYLGMETDPAERNSAIEEMKKFWVMDNR
jgi:tetratricopeptide (TPR) repeat protein